MTAVTYKCPNCGAEIKFNPEVQKGKCDFCLSEFTIDEIERLNTLDNEHIKNGIILMKKLGFIHVQGVGQR